MLYRGRVSKLELLIEKINSSRDNLEFDSNFQEVSVGNCSSPWESGSEEGGRGSLSPVSSATPTSASETDIEAASTLGVTEATPYPCSFCDKAFPRLSYLKRHEQSHADQLPFRCEFCGRHFKHKRSRDRHVKLHTGDKKYKCTHCEAAFSRSDHLKIHLKTHDAQKPFQCSVCTRGYNTAAALTAHMQIHKAARTSSSSSAPMGGILGEVIGGGDPSLMSRLVQDSSEQQNDTETNYIKNADRTQEGLGTSEGGSMSPSSGSIRCPICHTSCRSNSHLQRHIARQHQEESNLQSPQQTTRPQSVSDHSPASSSSITGVPPIISGLESSPNSSSPCPRSTSSLISPGGALNFYSNPFLSLANEKLKCPFCNTEGITSFEAMQIHIQSAHGPIFNGEGIGGSALAGPLSSLRELGGIYPPLLSPISGAGCSRQVTCELCGARVNGVSALQRHVVTAHTFTELLARAAVGVFCTQCLVPFSNPGALAEHIKLVHSPSVLANLQAKRQLSPTNDSPTDLSKKARRDIADLPSNTLLCNQCDAPFSDFESFRTHLKSHLEGTDSAGSGNSSNCPECSLPFSSEKLLEEHLCSHLESATTEYGCHACAKYFNKPDELQKHLMDIHAHLLFRCALCKEMFDSKVSIQVHFAVKHSNESKVHRCLRCHLKFRSKSEFDTHLRVVHLTREAQKANGTQPETLLFQQTLGRNHGGGYRCLLCPSILATELEMTSHLSTHQRQFHCSLCDEAFHVEFLLDRHVQTKHCTELNGTAVCQAENLSKPSLSPRKDLRCGICDVDFTTENALNCHRKQAHAIKPGVNSPSTAKIATATLSLFCAYCNEVCKSRTDLEAHIKTHQGTGGRHKCNICDELFPSAATLAQHKLAHIKVISGNSCIICRETLQTAEQITLHQNDHHSATFPQPCIICRQTLIADIEIQVHAKFHGSHIQGHSVKTEANFGILSAEASSTEYSAHKIGSPIKNEGFVKKERLEESDDCRDKNIKGESYPSRGTPAKTFQCIKCQESFASEEEIESHVASHLLLEGSSHECHLCKAIFDSPLRLQCHLIEHTFEGCSSYTCYLCSSVFTTAARLQHHMVGHGLSAKPYDCHHCHLRFFFRAELENHLSTHPEANSEEASHGCPQQEIRQKISNLSLSKSLSENIVLGELTSRSDGNLVLHKAQASEISPSTSLKTREDRESLPSKPRVCKTCSRKFNDEDRLKLHSLTHEGGKPFLCSICGAAFTRRCEAAKHCKNSREKESYKCFACQEKYFSFSELKIHLDKSHEAPTHSFVRPDSRCSSCDGDTQWSESPDSPKVNDP